MTLIKICGITNLPDAMVVADAGADFLGFIFAPKSPRYIEPSEAKRLRESLPDRVTPVGVFVNEPFERVNEIVKDVGLGAVQLHGDESPGYAMRMVVDVIKVYRVSRLFLPADVADYPSKAVLLDSYVKDVPGGTGKTLNWGVAKATNQYAKVMLAGGLSPDNAVEAVEHVSPWAIDASSGVELSPGKKDHAAVARLIEQVRAVTE